MANHPHEDEKPHATPAPSEPAHPTHAPSGDPDLDELLLDYIADAEAPAEATLVPGERDATSARLVDPASVDAGPAFASESAAEAGKGSAGDGSPGERREALGSLDEGAVDVGPVPAAGAGAQVIEAEDDEPLLEVEAPVASEAPDDDRTVILPAAGARPPTPPPSPARSASRDHSATEPPSPTPLEDHATFRAEAQRFARGREWQKLAAVTSAAIDHASWATLPESRAALLLDLARIHRDRLKDPVGAEQAFRRLAQVNPTDDDALEFLARAYRERGDWRAVYDLTSAAIEPTWDPNQRLAWTRETASIAADRLRAPDLAIEAWERLDRLGDAPQETYNALSQMYRRAGRWDRLAEFLAKRAARLEGSERILALREVAEAYLSGLRDHDSAAAVLEDVLAARPDDTVALLAYARVLAKKHDWEGLSALGAHSLEGVVKPAVLDFRRVVAEALTEAGQGERAAAAWERVLELDGEDEAALRAKEAYLESEGHADELVHFLSERADHVVARGGDGAGAARAELLARAARLAETKLADARLAVSLWEKCLEANGAEAGAPGRPLFRDAHRALERLYDRLGDLVGVARSLEGQLSLAKKPEARVRLLRRLGEHAAHRMGDDGRAELCWRELAALEPGDRATQEELLALHRRRRDFEALDRALTSQGYRAFDREEVLGLFRAAAENVEAHLADPARAIAAHERVLDLAPDDPAALSAQVAQERARGARREIISALEAELRRAAGPAGDEVAARMPRALEIARLWEEEGDRVAAVAAYERALRWDEADGTALAGISLLHTGRAVGTAIGALEVAAARRGARGEAEARVGLLREALALADAGDALGRFYTLRRILWLSGGAPSVLAELERAAEAASAFSELFAVHQILAAEATDEGRARHLRALAAIAEHRLGDANRAYLLLQSRDRRPFDVDTVDEALAPLLRLADATSRHEDLLAVLDASSGAERPLAFRQRMLRLRADVLEQKLRDPVRAFAERARLLHLDPRDAQALADVERLADEKGLHRALDALYAELWDRAESDEARIAVARRRHDVRKGKLGDGAGALEQLLVIHRIDPTQPGLVDQIVAAAGAEKAWDHVLPLLEAHARSTGQAASPAALAQLAALHERHRDDFGRAFELFAEAFVLAPEGSDAAERESDLARVADKTGRRADLARVYRRASARATSTPRKLELLSQVTKLAPSDGTPLGLPPIALDAHRLILSHDPAALVSLEVVIERHRAAGEWRELRDRLQQLLEHAPAREQAASVPRLLEIARLSHDRLGDAEAALAAFALVLEIEPQNVEASAGVRALAGHAENPAFELRRLRVELPRAPRDRRAEIQLAVARIEQGPLGDADAAVRTLTALVDEMGADGPGFAPLAELLRERSDFAALASLLEARAARLEDAKARAVALAAAVELVEAHADAIADGPARLERLSERLLAEHPDNLEARRRLLALYREGGRAEPLAALLAASAAHVDDEDERRQYTDELTRVLAHSLGRPEEAEATLVRGGRRAEGDDLADTLLARASIARARGQFAAWLELRQQHARLLPSLLASIVYCALAEACDETPGQQLRVAGLYREARALDPQNAYAMEALKAIGRRARGWRAQAALLADADEASLSPTERAARLTSHGHAAAEGAHDPARAMDFYQRAIAVDPDQYAAWDALARLRAGSGDLAGALSAERSSLAAWERATPPSPASLREHAARIYALSQAERAAGHDEAAHRLAVRAHRLAPRFAPATMAVADRILDGGAMPVAFALYDRVLRDPAEPLAPAERIHATWRRGALAWRLGDKRAGIADLSAALALDPLHAGALESLAEAEAETGRVVSAAERYVQALLVEHAGRGRASLYARLGRLFDDQLKNGDEAGVCYDLSIGLGGTSAVPDLMSRALAHYLRQGRPERALEVIERLLPTTDDPRELASLWTERGTILAGAGDEDRAVEAYDMALSYDPSSRGAITGLSQILERRGDWEQLAQIFEARTETGSPEERAEALRALARMATAHLQDPSRTAGYLRAAVELAPTREDFEQLLSLYGDDPAAFDDRLRALSGLFALGGGPFMPHVIELGRALAARGERRWAWCILSPLMSSTLAEPTVKTLVLELRKEFEKSDNTAHVSPDTHRLADAGEFEPPLADLAEIVAELDDKVVLGRATLEDVGAGATGKLDERTAVGKTFAGIAARLGLAGTQLTRAPELAEPYLVLDGEAGARHVVVRAELLQLLSIAETCFLFTLALEESRPGRRLLASLAPTERALLVPALYAAVGLGEPPSGSARLVEAIRAGLGDDVARYRTRLSAIEGDPKMLGASLRAAQLATAQRVALVAAADLRFAARVLTRLDESLPKMQTVGRIDDVDEFIAAAPPVRALLQFAVTPLFGSLLRGGGARASTRRS